MISIAPPGYRAGLTRDEVHELRELAHELVVQELEARGNVLSMHHRVALVQLVGTMAEYAGRFEFGRKVYPLPTGLGKTTAIRCFFIALHRLGHEVPVSVAATKVEALCDLKRELIAGGIPEHLIGLKHASPGASLPSTGDEDRRYMLVTHTRVRGGSDYELFGKHRGVAAKVDRPLMIVDETILRGESLAISVRDLRAAVAAASANRDGDEASVVQYFHRCLAVVEDTLVDLKASPTPAGVRLQLPMRPPWSGLREQLAALRLARQYGSLLAGLLDVANDPLQLLSEGSVEAILWCREAVPELLRHVLVLDASYPVKVLSQTDRLLDEIGSSIGVPLKSHRNVRVTQIMAAGGYNSIMAAQLRGEVAPVVAEVSTVIEAEWTLSRGILVFTYKPRERGDIDQMEAIRLALRAKGLDPDAMVETGGTTATGQPELQPKLRELTFGQESSLNGFEYCDVVILAGVLHRSESDIAAALRAQAGDLAFPTPLALIRETIESEIAAVVYQALSRGSCRRMDNGEAGAMRGYVIHRDLHLEERMDKVMPGLSWERRAPVYLDEVNASGVTLEAAKSIARFLEGLPAERTKVSSIEVKKALAIPNDAASQKAFTRGGDLVQQFIDGWGKALRGFVRTTDSA